MGVDIHGIVEIRKDGKWEVVEDVPELFQGCRNYELFNFLQENSEPGVPEELEGKRFRYEPKYDYYEVEFTRESGCYNYGFGYITLAELEECIKGMNRGVFVSASFLEEFNRLGGVMPEGLQEGAGEEQDGIVRFSVVEDADDYCDSASERWFAEGMRRIGEKHAVQDADIRAVFYFDC